MVYIYPDVVLGRHVVFAVDNLDFADLAIYQRQEPGDVAPELTVDPGDQCRHSIRQLPESVTTLLECPARPWKTSWSHLPPVWIVYRRPTSIVLQDAKFHMASRTQFDQNDHQWRS